MEVKCAALNEKERRDRALALACASPAWFGPHRVKSSIWMALVYAVFFAGVAVADIYLSPENSPWVSVVNIICLVAGVAILALISVRCVQLAKARKTAAEETGQPAGTVRVNGKGVAFVPAGGAGVAQEKGAKKSDVRETDTDRAGAAQGVRLKWAEVTKLLVTRRLYIFVTDSGADVALPKECLSGKADALEGYIASHMQGKGKLVLRDE